MHVDSYYAATIKQPSRYHALSDKITCQTCVVGGGYAGLTTARELARSGHEVVLLEAECVGWGASGRNGGFVSAGFANSMESIAHKVGWEHARELYQLSAVGRDYIRDTVQELDLDDVILGKGWLSLLRHGSIDDLTKSREIFSKKLDVEFEVIDKCDLDAYVRSPKYQGGMLDVDAFHIHPLRYAQALGLDVVKKGGRIYEGSRCYDLCKSTGGTGGKWLVKTSRGQVEADNVVLATSAYGGPFAPLNRAIIPVATYVVSSEPATEALNDAILFKGCVSDTRRSGDYYRVIDNGAERHLIWGGRITTLKTQPKRLAEMLLNDIVSVYPQLFGIRISKAWSGLMGYTVHKMPIITQLEQGLWSATAFGGQGLNTSSMAGQLISDAILHGSDQYRLFDPYGPTWSGGIIGKIATQLEYWRLQYLDKRDENA